jgi:hypothetical protein
VTSKIFVIGLTALFIGLLTVAWVARVSPAKARVESSVSIEHRVAPERVVLVFIDSLSRDVATDSELMPTLSQLARTGAAFDVEPCRDQLTYLCLRAALTGHDDSSLLAISDNFRPDHDAPPATLLSALASKRERVTVIGSNDFHPYRRSLYAEHALAKHEETPEAAGAMLKVANHDDARLLIVSLASGDTIAHIHGVASTEYRETFHRLDRVVKSIAEGIDSETHLVVFGDHGHDEHGRHLPGTTSRTWTVYRGPAFRAGVTASLHITDHRALLGVLLGVASEPSYRGPPLASIFAPRWTEKTLTDGLPKLQEASSEISKLSPYRCLWAAGIGLISICVAWSLLAHHRRRRLFAGLALSATLGAAAIGFWYDAIRGLVHDHGDSPERALSLLVPVAAGCLVAVLITRQRRLDTSAKRLAWPPVAAACSLVTVFLLLLPSSYYYGSRRAVILAAIVAVATVLAPRLRRSCSHGHRRLIPIVALVFVMLVLWSLYPVQQLGPQTAGASTWSLDARLYTEWAWLPLVLSKVALYLIVIAPGAWRRQFDTAGAAGLLSACLLIELAGVRLPREIYASLFCALLIGLLLLRRHASASLLAGSLLLLEHLYSGDKSHLAPIEMILAATAAALLAWRHLIPTAATRGLLAGLTVTLAVYLMLWPTVGFHVAGIDFGFMFQWVPAATFEHWWRLIAFGAVVKLALPLILVMVVARKYLGETSTRLVVAAAMAAKVVLLSVMIAFFAAEHATVSQQATAMLAELILVMFALCCLLVAMPFLKPLAERRARSTYKASAVARRPATSAAALVIGAESSHG